MAATFIPVNLTVPSYMSITDYERNFDVTYWRKAFGEFWIVPFILSIFYLICLYQGTALMKPRKPFKINGLLILWNIGLSIFSIWAFSRSFPDLLNTLLGKNGFYHSVCEWTEHSHASAFWGFSITVSKVIELGDTAFIVLRKKKLSFIHYYHHVATLLTCWHMYYYYEPCQVWFAVMNTFVHSLMYTYYTIRALNIGIPKIIAMSITSLQLMQMFMGAFINLYSFWLMYVSGTAADCPNRFWIGVKISSALYFSFVFLFAKFFINAYLVKGKDKSKKV